MKKVYIPTEDEIEKLKYLGINSYQYLLSKTVETLIMEDVIYEDIDMFDVAYEELHIEEIRYALAMMYPEKIASSEFASNDLDLCRMLTKRVFREDKAIYQLDNLSYFNQDWIITGDDIVIENVSKFLAEHLTSQPRYRFDYKEPNKILDDIFACEIDSDAITPKTYDDLLSIDPIYITKLGLDLDKEKRNYSQNRSFGLSRGLVRYIYRYNMEKVDRTNQQEKVKKLVRYLDSHKQNYQKIFNNK